jgi:hypothetical protein
MPIENVKIIDNLKDLEKAFDLLKKPWINHPHEYIQPYEDAVEHFKNEGFPKPEDVSVKHINATDENDLMHKYVLLEGSLRFAVTQNIISSDEYEQAISAYENFFMSKTFDELSKLSRRNITFDWM